MEYLKTINYLIHRRLKLIMLSTKIANDKKYAEEYLEFQEEIRILDGIIDAVNVARNEEKYKSKVHHDQVELL